MVKKIPVADLMVSAAAWMVLIQGQTAFTRREVIDVFEGIPGEHSKTLEARIKGFVRPISLRPSALC